MDFIFNYNLISDFAIVGIVHRNKCIDIDLDF